MSLTFCALLYIIHKTIKSLSTNIRHSVSGIRKGEYFRLGHSFKCGFLESNCYLPVRHAALEIEITIVSDADEPVIKGVSSESATTVGGDRGGAYFLKETPRQNGNLTISF